jgi:uncharacterized protein YigE (DUF2233 family)
MSAALRALLLAVWGISGTVQAVQCGAAVSAGKQYTVCRVDIAHEHLQLFLRDDGGQPFKRFDPLEALLEAHGRKLTFAMNAGMYHPDFSPVGLFASAGSELAALNTDPGRGNFFLKPNGVFYLTAAGAGIVESSTYPKLSGPVILATQSGPLLVSRGAIHPAFVPASTSRLIRNGVGVPAPDTAIFAISDEPVNFHEFAVLFRDVLGCPDALYLDGNISSLYSPELRRDDAKWDLGPIIGVVQ